MAETYSPVIKLKTKRYTCQWDTMYVLTVLVVAHKESSVISQLSLLQSTNTLFLRPRFPLDIVPSLGAMVLEAGTALSEVLSFLHKEFLII